MFNKCCKKEKDYEFDINHNQKTNTLNTKFKIGGFFYKSKMKISDDNLTFSSNFNIPFLKKEPKSCFFKWCSCFKKKPNAEEFLSATDKTFHHT